MRAHEKFLLDKIPLAMSPRLIYLAHIALLALYFGIALAALRHLPEAIPMHFDFTGRPTRWAPTTTIAWLTLPLVSAGTAAFMYGLMALSRGVPELWNFAEKEAFLELPPENRTAIQAGLEASVGVVAILTTLLMATLSIGGYEVAVGRSERLPAYAQLSVVVWFVVVLWIVRRAASRAGQEVRRISGELRAREARPG